MICHIQIFQIQDCGEGGIEESRGGDLKCLDKGRDLHLDGG